MKGTTTVSDFKDLKKAIEEITKNQPAETRYEKQAKVMGYTTKDTATVVVENLNEASAFDGMTKIVNDKQAQKVGGIMIDMFTASVILKAYTKVNASNKEKMKKANVHTLVALAQKVMGLNANYDNPLKGFPYNEVKESIMSENVMSDMLVDIQQGATAKELSKTYKMPLSTAKDFLKSYYGQKKQPMKMGEAIDHDCATHVEHIKFGSGVCLSGQHDLIEQEDGSFKVEHYTVKFSHGIEEMVSIYELNITKQEGHQHSMANKAGRKKLKAGWKKKPVNEAGMGDKIGKLFKTTDKKEIDGISNLMNMTDIKVLQSMMKQNPKGFKKMAKKMGELPAMEEVQEETIQEGTWQTPKNKGELKKLMDLVSKPVFATKPSDIDKYMKQMPFGDDELYDDLESLFYPKDSDGKIIYPIKRMKKFPKTDLNQVAMDSLNGRWLTAKKKGNGWDITHINFDFDEVEEAVKRKSGNLRPKKRMTLDMSQDMSEDEMSRAKEVIQMTKKHDQEKDSEKDKLEKEKEKAKQAADRAKQTESFVTKSPFKLKSKQYPRAIGTQSEGYGKRHASRDQITEACESFGMITDQELQLEKIERVLGKQGFLTYNRTELDDIFEDRETQRMILALESVTEVQLPTEYDRATIERALDEEHHVEFVKPDGMKAMGPVLKMSGNTYNLKDMHTGKSFTFKYIEEDTKVKTFNEVINEGKFPKKLVKMAGGVAFDKRYVGGNMSGAIDAIEKIKKGLSDDPQVKDMLKIANEAFNSQIFKSMSEEDKTAYQKFFMSALKKFGVSSPSELDNDKKKEFFDYVDKNWEGDNEVAESIEEGKYTAYSDLLLMKARIIDKEGPKSDKLPAVDSQIRIVMKRLGVKESDESPKKVDGRRTNFREKMRKLGYIKGR